MKGIGNGWMVIFIGALLAILAARWLLSPLDHPEASSGRVAAVVVQLLIGVVLLALGWRTHRAERDQASPEG